MNYQLNYINLLQKSCKFILEKFINLYTEFKNRYLSRKLTISEIEIAKFFSQ